MKNIEVVPLKWQMLFCCWTDRVITIGHLPSGMALITPEITVRIQMET